MSGKLNLADYGSQIELIVDSLEKREKKKAVSYYLKESTINRIKENAQKFDMKDSQFLEEVLIKVMDQLDREELEGKEALEQEALVLAKAEQAKVEEKVAEEVEEELDSLEVETAEQTSLDWNQADDLVDEDDLNYYEEDELENYDEEYDDIDDYDEEDDFLISKVLETSHDDSAEMPHAEAGFNQDASRQMSIAGELLSANEVALVDYLYNNYRQDYRMRYEDYERLVYNKLAIGSEELREISQKLHRLKLLTYLESHSLIDINKELFDLWE